MKKWCWLFIASALIVLGVSIFLHSDRYYDYQTVQAARAFYEMLKLLEEYRDPDGYIEEIHHTDPPKQDGDKTIYRLNSGMTVKLGSTFDELKLREQCEIINLIEAELTEIQRAAWQESGMKAAYERSREGKGTIFVDSFPIEYISPVCTYTLSKDRLEPVWYVTVHENGQSSAKDRKHCWRVSEDGKEIVGFIEDYTKKPKKTTYFTDTENSGEKEKKKSGSAGTYSYIYEDPYDVEDYDDPEDFYFDNEDEFEDIEDAEDYWEMYH